MLIQRSKKAAIARPFKYKPNSEMDWPLSWLATLDQHTAFLQSLPPYQADHDEQPVLSMSFLGKLGLFGNQIFQYAFLRICAEKSGARVQCSPWVGQVLFGHQDDPVACRLPPAVEYREIGEQRRIGESFYDFVPEFIPFLENVTSERSSRVGSPVLETGLANVDLWGFFQFHTRYLRPYRDYFRSLFQPVDDLKAALEQGLRTVRAKGKTIVCIHIRRKEYLTYPQARHTFPVPPKWYCEWLNSIWSELDNPVLFLCSDDPDSVLADFAQFHPLTARDLNITLPERLQGTNLGFYVDFYMLSNCDVAVISNSTFSFTASMLNERGRLFVRPHWDFSTKFTAFDPWDSLPLVYMRDEGFRYTKTLVDNLYATYVTQGIWGMLKSFFFYTPISEVKYWGLRAFLAYRAEGIVGVLKAVLHSFGIRSRWKRSPESKNQ